MQLSPDKPQTDPMSILLMGPPGSFKTTFMLQFPDLYVVDNDKNLSGPDRFLRKQGWKGNVEFDQPSYDEAGKPLDPSKYYDRSMELLKNAKVKPYSWVGFDGLTALNEFIIRKVMDEQKVNYMDARHWSSFKTNAIHLLFTVLRHINKNVIVIAHEQRIEKADAKNIMTPQLVGYEPFLQSKVSEMLGGFFTDVWRLSAKPAPADRYDWELQTMKVPFYDQLKNSIGLPPVMKNPTYKDIEPYIKGVK